MRFKNDSDQSLTASALRIAAERYDADALMLRSPPPGEDRVALECVAEQFDRQAADARRIAREIEESEA